VSRTERTPPEGLEVQRSGVLIERAATILAAGEASTEELAVRVLGLSGNRGAAASAVWALLAGDPRFLVSGSGVWSLRDPVAVAVRPLREESWVVVDVETTGGSPGAGHRVTEVAAVRVVGNRIDDVFSTLVNPGRPIPAMITSLTGISNQMVAGAPRFRDIAPRFAQMLGGNVFVAHNASFDWRFVCAEMELAEGNTLSGRQLCTVRLARKLLPQLPSRSLDALALHFGLEIAARHRAEDDAVATAHILLRFLDMLGDRGIEGWAGVESLLATRAARRKRTVVPRSMDSA
jgi:DNA polymerase III epsilon subunit family exonuclease